MKYCNCGTDVVGAYWCFWWRQPTTPLWKQESAAICTLLNKPQSICGNFQKWANKSPTAGASKRRAKNVSNLCFFHCQKMKALITQIVVAQFCFWCHLTDCLIRMSKPPLIWGGREILDYYWTGTVCSCCTLLPQKWCSVCQWPKNNCCPKLNSSLRTL